MFNTSRVIEEATVLRSDDPAPRLQLVDMSDNANDDFVSYASYIPMNAALTGSIGAAEIQINVEFDDLCGLIGKIEGLHNGRVANIEWRSWDGQIKLEMRVISESFGPPVLCKASLARLLPDLGPRSSAETYECTIYTNLSWIGTFLSGLQQMMSKYEQTTE